jgi:hypothetical protein
VRQTSRIFRFNRRHVRLAATLLLVLIVASSPFTLPRLNLILPTLVQLPPASVIDPSTEPLKPPVPLEVLLFAGQIIDQATAEHYENASSLLKLAAVLPSNLQQDLSIYLSILAEVKNHLNLTNTYLNETSTSINQGQHSLARTQLGLARSELTQAQSNLATLNLTLSRIGSMFGISVLESHRAKLDALSLLIDRYSKRADELERMLTEADSRTATFLDMEASAKEIPVNETVTLTGHLKDSHGKALPSRAVRIYLQGSAFEETRTSGDGSFRVTVRISPEMNLTTAIFYAQFQPQGTDANSLRPSVSPDVVVAVRYLQAQISLSLGRGSVHVNQTFGGLGALRGQDGTNPLTGRMIQLAIDGRIVGTTQTDKGGLFTFQYSFPPGTPELTHNVTATFTPIDDLYSTQSESAAVSVYYYHTSVRATFSLGWLFSGQPLQVRGTVQGSSTPIRNGTLLAFLDGVQDTNTTISPDGGFQLSLSIPLEKSNVTMIGFLYEPTLPFVTGSSASYSVTVTNSLSVLVGSSALAVVGIAVYKSPRTILRTIKRSIIEEEETEEEKRSEKLEEEEKTRPPEPAIDIAKLREGRTGNQVVKAVYWAVRDLVASKLEISSPSSLTHLEFFNATKALKKGHVSLRRITGDFELAEYAERPFSKRDVSRFLNDSVVVVEAAGGTVEI